jgi:hypothetical protein
MLERFSGTIEATGNIQGWPFTESLEDLLGLRRNFMGTVDATLWHLGARDQFTLFKDIALTVHSDLYRLYPDVRFSDWMPTFMVFGVTDLDQYRDDYDRIDFGRLRLDLSGTIGVIYWGASVSQLFPIKVKKDGIDIAGGTVNQSGDVIHSSSGDKPTDDGGRRISIRLGVRF